MFNIDNKHCFFDKEEIKCISIKGKLKMRKPTFTVKWSTNKDQNKSMKFKNYITAYIFSNCLKLKPNTSKITIYKNSVFEDDTLIPITTSSMIRREF